MGYLGKKYFNGGVCDSKNKLNDKNVIVTGANCGIGYETALDLAQRGWIIDFFLSSLILFL